MNILQIAGNLGTDPVVRFTSSGQKVTTFSMATNTKKGENTITIWYRVTIWGDRFDKMLTYLKKGSSVIVVGELQKPEIYTDKEGRQQISLELWAELIRFSPFGKPAEQRQEQTAVAASFSQGGHSQNNGYGFASNQEGFGEQTFGGGSFGKGQQSFGTDMDDEIPF